MTIINLLKKYCDIENPENTGLLLLDLPTGFGKTYETLKFIYENYQKSGKKIIFLTELKKNLPHDTILKKFFEKDNLLADFEKDIVFINSNVDCVLENLIPNEKAIPEFVKGSEEYKNLKRNIIDFKNLSEGRDETSTRLSEKIKAEIQREIEPKFRQFISNSFYKDGKTKEERIALLKSNKNFQWVSRVYPSTLSSEKKIFFLSVDKFLVKNSPIVQKSYYFFDKDFLKNALIFIDEFDASKEVILRNIIETQLKKRIDIIGMFEQIYSSFNSLTIPEIYYKNSKQWEKKKEMEPDLQNIAQVIDNLKNEVFKINKEYRINYSVKTFGLSNQKNFLFHDYQYHTIVGDRKSFIYLQQDDNERINNIHFVEADKTRKDKPSITEFLTAIKGFINYFKGGVKLIAENYQQIKNENTNTEDFSFESALSSFFDELKLTEEQKAYLLDSIQVKQFQNKQKNRVAEIKNDFSFYSNGFRYYDFEDSEMHDTKSKIFVTDFDKTPEKLLLDLACNNLVVGISATAKMKTVIGNYDLKYLRKNLPDRYLELDIAEIEALKIEFAKRNENYVSVKAEFLDVEDWRKTLKNFAFDRVLNNEILMEFERHKDSGNQNFNLKRYLKIAKVFEEFIRNDNIHSFLCFLNTHPTEKENSNCKQSVLEMLFRAVVQKHKKENLFLNSKGGVDIKKSFRILNSKNFEDKKEEILETLKTGQKLFLITTYATLGAGQNIQYGVDNFDEWLANGKIKQTYTPEGYFPEKLKDFDAIYLDKPSNLLVNINTEELSNFDVNKRIFQAEMLFQSNKIFYQQLVYEIKNTFKKAYYIDRRFDTFFPREVYKSLYSTEDYRNYVAKEVIQAIGRINRTHFKNNEVYIFADKEIAPQIKFFDTSNYLCLKEFEALISQAQFDASQEPQENDNIMEIEQNNIYCHKWITSKINGRYWNEQNIADWQELREIVLKYPTVSHDEFINLADLQDWRFIFIPMLDAEYQNFEPKNRYHFIQENDYSTIEIDFSSNGKEVSGEIIHLPELMQITDLKNMFQSQGYSTNFKINDYIIAPEIFNNIYKGGLGETIGKFIFEKYILNEIKLQELPASIFERFDFMLDKGVFIDFKFWNDENIQNQQDQIDKIFGLKIPDIRQKGFEFNKVFVVNILANNRFPIRTTQNGQLIEVPYLIDSKSFTIAENVIFELRNLLNF